MTSATIEELLSLTTAPVAISFLPQAPPGVPAVARGEAASCGYWSRAAAGEVFYTEARHHLSCAVGAHTHGVPVPPERQNELTELIQIMVGLEYLQMEEVPKIPHRQGPFGVVVYAPLAQAPCPPEIVLVRGSVRQLMLLAEAAQAAGVGSGAPTLGRPTCAVLPQALQSDRTAASFGCVGNRVYTGAGDGEGYFAIPGKQLSTVVEKLGTIVRANQELLKFHEARKAAAASSEAS